jgi:D-alanyl-D-alanine carboxypeptidase
MGIALTGCVVAAEPPEPAEAITIPLVVEAPPATESAEVVIEEAPSFDKGLHSLDDAGSLWVIVNKARAFDPLDYEPEDLVVPSIPANYSALLRADASAAVAEMHEEATSLGVGFTIHSSYRSYRLQERVKRQSVERYGQRASDARSARPGHSEHQSGLAVDLTTNNGVCTLAACFGQTPEGLWLFENSWRFGFVLRYLEGATDITGYIYEPWHFRYVGVELATEMWNQGYPTLEEFFGLDPAPAYLD